MFASIIAALILQAAEPAETVTISDAIRAVEAQDYERAFSIAEEYAAAGSPDGQHLLGHLYANGLGVQKDVAKAVEHYVSAAKAGQVNAQFALGELAYTGEGAKQDWQRAAEWFNLAAAQGHMLAKTRLAYMYSEGQSVPQDMQRAAALFKEAAAAGVPAAQYHLALLYLEGNGMTKDLQEAAHWFELAAKNGDADSMYNLALMLEAGRITGEPDYVTAVNWMRQAARAGVLPAKTSMGLFAYNGRGMERNEAEALKWFRASAEDGDAEGMFLYAVGLSEGLGGRRDFNEALRWAEKSLEQSYSQSPQSVQERIALRDQLRDILARQRLLAERQETEEVIRSAQSVSLFSQPVTPPPARPAAEPQAPTATIASQSEEPDTGRRRRGLRR